MLVVLAAGFLVACFAMRQSAQVHFFSLGLIIFFGGLNFCCRTLCFCVFGNARLDTFKFKKGRTLKRFLAGGFYDGVASGFGVLGALHVSDA